jgi:hypothetical protein
MPFSHSDEDVNICCIVFMMYMVVFLITRCMQPAESEERNEESPEECAASDEGLKDVENHEVGKL